MNDKHFPDAQTFRAWLKKNHDKQKELLLAFHRDGTGKKSIAYPEARDDALCFGWIDGVRKNAGPAACAGEIYTPQGEEQLER